MASMQIFSHKQNGNSSRHSDLEFATGGLVSERKGKDCQNQDTKGKYPT
jgi:hypothetical protein